MKLGITALLVLAATLCARVNSQSNPYRTVEHRFTLPEGRTMVLTSAVRVAPSGHIRAAELWIEKDGSIWLTEGQGANGKDGKKYVKK